MFSCLVERASHVYGAVLDDLVHHLRDGLGEVRVRELEDRAFIG